MLACHRKQGEGVLLEIPPSTEWRTARVVLVRGNRGQQSWAIDAPKDIRVVRTELLNQGGRPNNGEELD
jgi:sRNA-binding carbon storage regulator CsrA